MVDEMLVTQAPWLPQYTDAIAEAKGRLDAGNLLPTNDDYQGAARLKTKTVEEMANDKAAARSNAAEADKGQERTAKA
jgi:alpha-galactosidase